MASATTPKSSALEVKKVVEQLGVKFVNCDLTAEQKAVLASWVSTLDTQEWLDWLVATVTLGHVISVRANDYGYQCSVTGGSKDGSTHANMSLVARASTPLKAIQAAMFKDQSILAGKWTAVSRNAELDI